MNSTLAQLNRPTFSENSIEAISSDIRAILSSGSLMLGEWTERLESAFGKSTGTAYAVTTNTCTTAIQICLQYYDIVGREVLVPSGSFISDISVIRWAGGIPVLVDMNPATLSFDLADLRSKLTARTKGILWVHLTGIISKEYQEIVAFAKTNGLFLIEDCAHAHGAMVDGACAGSLGDAGCFSFFPGKLMTTGCGGIITTDVPELETFSREMRVFGRSAKGDGSVVREGNDWFMDELRACLGWHQLQELGAKLTRRREIAHIYDCEFAHVPGITTFSQPPGNLPSYYQYAVLLDQNFNRDVIVEKLKRQHGVAAKRIYLPTHCEPIFSGLAFDRATLQQTERTLNTSICLPGHHELTEGDVAVVVESVKKVVAATA